MSLISVNNYHIDENEFLAELYELTRQKGLAKPDKEVVQQAVDNLIKGVLILNEARKQDISVSEDEVESQVLEHMMQYRNEQRYQEELRGMKVNADLIKGHLKNSLIIKKYLNSVIKIPENIDEDRLYECYKDNIDCFIMDETVKVSHILIKPEMGIEKAQQMKDNINTPEDFHNVVGRCSNCPSCLQAGDLGYIAKGKMVAEFEEAAFNLDINEISSPVKSQFGYHIIMVTDKKTNVTLSFDRVKDFLKKRMQKIEYELGVVKLVQELRNKADIFISDSIWSDI